MVHTKVTEVSVKMADETKRNIPLLPLRGLLVYPTMVLHLDVGREKSVQALEQAMMNDHMIFLATQKDISIDEPDEDEIFTFGTYTKIKQMLKLPNGTIRVLVEGLQRARILEYHDLDEYTSVKIERIDEETEKDVEDEALMRTLLDHFDQYIKISKKISAETFAAVTDIEEPGRMADIVASHLPLKLKDKQEVLETIDVKARLNKVIDLIHNEKEVLEIEKKIGQRVKRSMERTQKEYYLREQMKAIQKELGDKEGKTGEVQKLTEKIEQAGMPDNVKETALKEPEPVRKNSVQISAESLCHPQLYRMAYFSPMERCNRRQAGFKARQSNSR